MRPALAGIAVTIGCLIGALALACPMPDAWWWLVAALNVGNAGGLLLGAIQRHGGRHV